MTGVYHDGQRALQDRFDTRRLADRLEDVKVHDRFTDDERALLAASIEEAARQLSPGARQVFMLHDVEGFTHEEIAESLGITAGGSKSQLFKARAKLRRPLAHLVDGPGRGGRSTELPGEDAPPARARADRAPSPCWS